LQACALREAWGVVGGPVSLKRKPQAHVNVYRMQY
jgi:hypothetical protein